MTRMIQKQSQATLAEFWIQAISKCSQQWHNYWTHWIKSQGDYFAGDSMEEQVNAVIINKNTLSLVSTADI